MNSDIRVGYDMPEVNFEKKEAVEKEIKALEEKLAEKKAELLAPVEKKENNLAEQEAVLDSIIETPVPSAISDDGTIAPQTAQTSAPADEDLSGEEKFEINQLKKMDKESQLKFLVNISFKKGLDEGVKLVKVLNNAFLTDEFHDKLVDSFYKKLVEEKKLEEL